MTAVLAFIAGAATGIGASIVVAGVALQRLAHSLNVIDDTVFGTGKPRLRRIDGDAS